MPDLFESTLSPGEQAFESMLAGMADPSRVYENSWRGSALVYGKPEAMGSKRGFLVAGRVNVVDVKNAKLRTFQEGMRESMRDTAPAVPFLGPIEITLRVYMARPKSHFGTGRNARILKANAPMLCTTKPDADKVLRAVQDCGTGIWFKDDSQVARVIAEKAYTDGEARTEVEARCISCVEAREERAA